jgi:phenylacetate-CoA ligase
MKITFLEGQYELARKTIEETPECGMMPVREMNRKIFDDYRTFALRRTVKRVYEHSRFYRTAMETAGIRPEEIRGFEDLVKLPFTFPGDLRGNSYNFLCMSERYVERPISFYSSGTTGIKKRMFFSFHDIGRVRDFIGTAMNSIADTEDTRILSLMTNSNGRGASQVYVDSVKARGMEAFTGNMEDGAEEILLLSQQHGCNVWFGDIGTIYRTAKELEELGYDLSSIGMKLIYVTMGNISAPVRAYLENIFQCELITHYGLTEVGWGFAIEQPGLGGYYTNELDVYTEVVDPKTGKVLPAGEEGELTYTIIGKEAMPLIRYRSGDIASIRRAGEEGQLDLVGLIQRRLEGIFTTPSGIEITPARVEEVLYTFPQVIDYRLYNCSDHVGIEVETVGAGQGSVKAQGDLGGLIRDKLSTLSGMNELGPAEITFLPRGELKKYCFEKKRFVQKQR